MLSIMLRRRGGGRVRGRLGTSSRCLARNGLHLSILSGIERDTLLMPPRRLQITAWRPTFPLSIFVSLKAFTHFIGSHLWSENLVTHTGTSPPEETAQGAKHCSILFVGSWRQPGLGVEEFLPRRGAAESPLSNGYLWRFPIAMLRLERIPLYLITLATAFSVSPVLARRGVKRWRFTVVDDGMWSLRS